jgi:hypothetical protein
MGLFDTSLLLASQLGVGETKRIPLPVADAVTAQLGKPTFVEGTGKDGNATTVDKTWTFKKTDDGKLRIVLHHSSLPYSAD